jgi:hypothetical protein
MTDVREVDARRGEEGAVSEKPTKVPRMNDTLSKAVFSLLLRPGAARRYSQDVVTPRGKFVA